MLENIFKIDILIEPFIWFYVPHQSKVDWVPQDIQDDYGEFGSSVVYRDWLTFKAEDEKRLIAAFRKHVYVCIRKDNLIEKAIGII